MCESQSLKVADHICITQYPLLSTMPSSIIRRVALDMLAATAALTPADFESYEIDKYLAEFKMRWKCGMSLLRHAARESVNDTEDDYDDDDDYEDEDDGETDDEDEESEDDDDYETEEESIARALRGEMHEVTDDDDDDYETEGEDEESEDEDEYDDLPELVDDAESVCSNDESDDESVCGQF